MWKKVVVREGVQNGRIMERKIRKNDIVLIITLAVTALAVYLGTTYFQGKSTKNAVAVIKIDGEEYGRYPLTEEITERIELPEGGYNVLKITEGRADITEASCPDKICVNHRAVSRKGQSIVCLPNKVVIEIENGKESDVDAITH